MLMVDPPGTVPDAESVVAPKTAQRRSLGQEEPSESAAISFNYRDGKEAKFLVGAHVHLTPMLVGLPVGLGGRRFTVEPPLPEGLFLDQHAGVIEGKPAKVVAMAVYEVQLQVQVRPDGLPQQILTRLRLQVGEAFLRGSRLALEADMKSIISWSRQAFNAVEDDDADALFTLAESGQLTEDFVRSHELVDEKGRTLLGAALAKGRRRAANFLRNGLARGPSYKSKPPSLQLSALPYVTPMGLEEVDFRRLSSVTQGLDTKAAKALPELPSSMDAPGYVLTYPEMPSVVKCRSWFRFCPRLAQSDGGPEVSMSSMRSPIHFAAVPSLPAGMTLHEYTGVIEGFPTQEVQEREFQIQFWLQDGRFTDVSSGSYIFRLATRLAPAGLTYPRVEKVVEVYDDELLRKAESHLPPSDHPDAGDTLTRLGLVKFCAAPAVREGTITRYEMLPALPKGMLLDEKTGVISGLPENAFPAVFRNVFEVFGYNDVGFSACKIDLEILGGSWSLASVKLHTVGLAETMRRRVDENSLETGSVSYSDCIRASTPGSSERGSHEGSVLEEEDLAAAGAEKAGPTLSAWLGRSCPGHQAAELDWNNAVDKVAVLLQKCGKAMLVKEPSCAQGVRLVRGLKAATLVSHLGVRAEPHHSRRLLHLIEQRGRLPRYLPSEATGHSNGSVSASIALHLAVAMEDPNSPCDAMVYLFEPGPKALPPAPREVPPALEARKRARSIFPWAKDVPPETAASRKVNEEFSSLLPTWRAKIVNAGPREKLAALHRWRKPHMVIPVNRFDAE